MSFTGKVIVVTGASSGIGAAAAVIFAKEGGNVVMVGRNVEKLNDTADKVAKSGEAPLVVTADVSNDDDAKRIIKTTIDKFGKLDVLVNNAGFTKYGTSKQGTVLDAFYSIINTNVRAVIHLTSLATPYLIESKGNVLNVSSAASTSVPTDPRSTAYCVTKAALDQFTRAAASELASFGVRVNSVNPGPVVTDFFVNGGSEYTWDDLRRLTALNRVSAAEELADLITYIASDRAKSVTGSILVADNGFLLRNPSH